MKTPLLHIIVPSIYEVNGTRVALPERMAKCPPDMKMALHGVGEELRATGGRLILSDLFRSYEMQLGSYMDYRAGKKKAFSPPPGGSLHEGGRALDLDLGALKMPLRQFWPLAAKHGLTPIIAEPNPRTSEAWHFERRGSHALVYEYYKARRGTNFDKPYQAMAASSIVSVGVRVDKFRDGQDQAYIQSALIRLGQNIGNLDGQIGPKTLAALSALGLELTTVTECIAAVDLLLQAKFPVEFFDRTAAVTPIV